MGLFSKRSEQNATKPIDLIQVTRLIREPPASYPVPEGIPELSTEQHDKYKHVLEYFQDEKLVLPLKSGKKQEQAEQTAALSAYERFWLTRECLLRYLRATGWNVEAAIERLRKTLVWRREFGVTGDPDAPNSLKPEMVEPENATGKQVLLGFDPERRPIYMMKNGRQNTEPSFAQVQHLVFFMEAAIALMPQGVELLALLIDFRHYKEAGVIGAKSPPISLAKQILSIIQDHYPERLGKALFFNMPWYGWTFLKLMHPFIDPVTRSKLVYDEPFSTYIDAEQLEATYGGKLDFHYKHEEYWPDFVSVFQERKEYQYARFLKFGALIGLSEFDLKSKEAELRYPVDYNPSIEG
ncbi:AaceriAFR660Wp [[Ashbya] aceris (nom. inval.)]|nr:AaceriAFR660Wp [[Ashbya] aceris (nom. inval.)]